LIKFLKKDVNYWLVRTTGGAYYDHFVNKNFIAIGWNEISDVNSFKEACKDTTVKENLR